MPLIQVTKAINSCISPQCADDLFTAGVDEEEEVDELSVESEPEPEPVLTHKEKMLAIKKKYKISIKALSDYRFVFQRFDKNNNGKKFRVCKVRRSCLNLSLICSEPFFHIRRNFKLFSFITKRHSG